MSDNVYKWRMSAASDKKSIDRLREEIISSAQNSRNFPMKQLVFLLPIQTNQAGEIVARGQISFNGNAPLYRFTNRAATELFVELQDPVLGSFTVTIPALWTGTLRVANETIEITFNTPIDVEFPKLVEMGINRSLFQHYEGGKISPSLVTSIFRDVSNRNNVTLIEASLLSIDSTEFPFKEDMKSTGPSYKEDLATMLTFANFANPCGPDPNARNWRVICQKAHHTLHVHYGDIVLGANDYCVLWGPDTKANCENWENTNYPTGICTCPTPTP